MRNLLTAIGLEGLYQAINLTLMRSGVRVSRQQFISTPGQPVMLPLTAIELAQMGAQIVGWQAHLTPVMNGPRKRQFG